jgi:hypothetical protein
MPEQSNITSLQPQIVALAATIYQLPVIERPQAILALLQALDAYNRSWEASDAYLRMVIEPVQKALAIRVQQDRW